MLRTPAPLIGALGVRRKSQSFVIPIASVSANRLSPYPARALNAHSNVLRYWFHWWQGCLGGNVQPMCSISTKSWPRALTRYSVVPPPRGLTASHRLRLKPPGLRATPGSQAQSEWRPSWAERPNRSETRARLVSPGSKHNDDLPEGLEPRKNVRKKKRYLPRMLPNTSNTDLNSSLTPNQPMERTPACYALRRRSSAR